MKGNPDEHALPAEEADLADHIIHELLRIARQWVVLRFLVDEESRQGGPIKLDDISHETFQRQASLFSVINELTTHGLIEWAWGNEGCHPNRIRITPCGRHFVVHILDSRQYGDIQKTIRDSHCQDIIELLDLLENTFQRLNV